MISSASSALTLDAHYPPEIFDGIERRSRAGVHRAAARGAGRSGGGEARAMKPKAASGRRGDTISNLLRLAGLLFSGGEVTTRLVPGALQRFSRDSQALPVAARNDAPGRGFGRKSHGGYCSPRKVMRLCPMSRRSLVPSHGALRRQPCGRFMQRLAQGQAVEDGIGQVGERPGHPHIPEAYWAHCKPEQQREQGGR